MKISKLVSAFFVALVSVSSALASGDVPEQLRYREYKTKRVVKGAELKELQKQIEASASAKRISRKSNITPLASSGAGCMEESNQNCWSFTEIYEFMFQFELYGGFEINIERVVVEGVSARELCGMRVGVDYFSLDDCSYASIESGVMENTNKGAQVSAAIADIAYDIIQRIDVPMLNKCARIVNQMATPNSDSALSYLYAEDAVNATYLNETSSITFAKVDVYYPASNSTINYYVSRLPYSSRLTLSHPTPAANGGPCS